MTKTLPTEASTISGPHVILKRPEAAVAMANVFANWALLERRLTNLYAFLMSQWSPVRATTTFIPSHPIAIQVMDAMQTIHAKLDLVEGILEWAAGEDVAAEFRDGLRQQIRKRATERNNIVHGFWEISNAFPDALVLRPYFGNPTVYDPSDFEAITQRICSTRDALNRLLRDLHSKAVVGTLREPKSHELHIEPTAGEWQG